MSRYTPPASKSLAPNEMESWRKSLDLNNQLLNIVQELKDRLSESTTIIREAADRIEILEAEVERLTK